MTTNANVTSNGDLTIHAHSGGDLQVIVTGVPAGATVTIKNELSDASAYEELPEAKVTKPSTKIYTLKAGNVRAAVTGATGATNLTVDIK